LEKSVFLVGRYQKDFHWNIAKLRRKFHIPRQKIGVIPYNMELEMATREGRLLQFLNRIHTRNEYAENAYLMRELKRSVMMLQDNMSNTGRTRIVRHNEEM
jgi:hypothetical protein